MAELDRPFDFEAHEQAAVTAYLNRHGFYADLASVVKRILEESLKRRDIKVHSVEARRKILLASVRKPLNPPMEIRRAPSTPIPWCR